jgi:RNA polymerase sigma factor (sigma-70 family)
MARAKPGTILRHLRDLVGAEQWRDRSDAELLQRFVEQRDDGAFAALVRRHGALVWGVCRQMLGHDQDAEDAFQAAFLAMARRAGRVRRGEAIAGWLHRVAGRVAKRAVVERSRRRHHERQAAALPRAERPGEGGWQELQAILQAELDRLPEKYRSAFIVCCLEGKSRAEAARQLDIKEGTLSSRLAHARQVLQNRLARRGVELPAMLTAAALLVAESRVPAAMVHATTQAAVLFAAGGNAATGYVSAQALTFAEEVIQAMFVTKLKVGAMVILTASVLVGGAGLAAYQAQTTAQPGAPKQADSAKTAEVRAEQPAPQEVKRPRTDLYGDPLPEGAMARLGTVRLRHRQDVTSVAFSPDGKILASSTLDEAICFWDSSTGKPIRELLDPVRRGSVAIAFSPDGTRLASVGEQSMVLLWEVSTGKNSPKRSIEQRNGFRASRFPRTAVPLLLLRGTTSGSGIRPPVMSCAGFRPREWET